MARKFSEEELETCRNADILSVIEALNYDIIKRGTHFFLAEHDSLCIFYQKNEWYWYSQGRGGNSLDFLIQGPPGYKFADAVETVLRITGGVSVSARQKSKAPTKEESRQPLIMPPKAKDNRRVIAYLVKTRGIDYDIVHWLLSKGNLYEAQRTHNAVFVARDEKGGAKHLTLRGTAEGKRFVQDAAGSDKRYGFTVDGKNQKKDILHIFESPIDLLSFLTIQKKKGIKNEDVYLSQSGTATNATEYYLSKHPEVKKLYVRTDNDDAGQKVAEKLKRKFPDIEVIAAFPVTKDYNMDLTSGMWQTERRHEKRPCRIRR